MARDTGARGPQAATDRAWQPPEKVKAKGCRTTGRPGVQTTAAPALPKLGVPVTLPNLLRLKVVEGVCVHIRGEQEERARSGAGQAVRRRGFVRSVRALGGGLRHRLGDAGATLGVPPRLQDAVACVRRRVPVLPTGWAKRDRERPREREDARCALGLNPRFRLSPRLPRAIRQ